VVFVKQGEDYLDIKSRGRGRKTKQNTSKKNATND